jgi:regulator of protease activity HflC (stomatin/prohibitin superfamily)
MTQILGIAVSLIIIGILVTMAVRIVPEFGRLVIFRLGRCQGAKGPGLVFMIPFVDRAFRVDLREVFFDVPPQTCITADNASVSIDFLVYDKVIDAERSVLAVTDFTGAARGLAITTLRAVVGAMDLDDVLSKREEINRILHEKLDDITDRWGIRIMAVEIREVRAEGSKRAAVLEAEGEREATIQRAQGFALALKEIDEIASRIDSKTLTLQYLEALKALGKGESTKLVIPTELAGLAQPLLAHVSKAQSETGAAG